MVLKQTLVALETLDNAFVTGETVADLFKEYPNVQTDVVKVTGEKGSTDFIKITIPGAKGNLLVAPFRHWGLLGD